MVCEGGGLQKLMGSAVAGCCVPCLPGMNRGRKEKRKLSWFLSQRPSVSQLGRKWGQFLLGKSRFWGPPHTHPLAVMSKRFFLIIFVWGFSSDLLAGDFVSSPRKHPVSRAVTQWKICLHWLDLFSPYSYSWLMSPWLCSHLLTY